ARFRVCAHAPRISGGIFDFDVKSQRLAEVEKELENPHIWDDQQRAQAFGKEKKELEGVVGTIGKLDVGLKDSAELFDLARADNDDATLRSIAADVLALEKIVEDLEFR